MDDAKTDLTESDPSPAPAAADEQTAQESQPRRRKGFVSLMIYGISGCVLLSAAIGGAIYQGWVIIPGVSSPKQSQNLEGKPEEMGLMVKLPPLIINIKGGSGQNYVKTKIVLEVSKKTGAEETQSIISSLTDIVILTLCEKQLEDLRQPGSKETLKGGFLARANQSLGQGKIQGIYFDEFIFQ